MPLLSVKTLAARVAEFHRWGISLTGSRCCCCILLSLSGMLCTFITVMESLHLRNNCSYISQWRDMKAISLRTTKRIASLSQIDHVSILSGLPLINMYVNHTMHVIATTWIMMWSRNFTFSEGAICSFSNWNNEIGDKQSSRNQKCHAKTITCRQSNNSKNIQRIEKWNIYFAIYSTVSRYSGTC